MAYSWIPLLWIPLLVPLESKIERDKNRNLKKEPEEKGQHFPLYT